MHKGEYETWELLRCLNLADKIYHTHKGLMKVKNQCPKTAAQSSILQNHKYLVILAVSRWLESIYKIPRDRESVDSSHLILKKSTFIDDFDTKLFDDQKFREGEKKIYNCIFEHLRSGKVYDIESKLRAINDFDHLQILSSINPLFDNIEFKEFMDETEDLFLMDMDRQENITCVDTTYEEAGNHNLAFGNRNNLMLI
jgi:hypothetical protein